jgi:NADPH:quinone reductase-like Zn-dependent oxidoreductase
MLVEPDRLALDAIATLVGQGRLRPHVGLTLPLEQAGKANELGAAGGHRGKIVLRVRP